MEITTGIYFGETHSPRMVLHAFNSNKVAISGRNLLAKNMAFHDKNVVTIYDIFKICIK